MIKCHLYEYRSQRGWSLDRLSQITGLSKSYLDYLENNFRLPRIDYAYRISDVFKISVYEMFEVTNELEP
jgi:transcriptional regulator with XRE-family HTH domain